MKFIYDTESDSISSPVLDRAEGAEGDVSQADGPT